MAQIFEQYVRIWGKDNLGSEDYYILGRELEEHEREAAAEDQGYEFHVTGAALEYRTVLSDSNAQNLSMSEAGTIIPVWNFYGTIGNGNYGTTSEKLLLSIGAEDGRIYAD